MGSLFTPSIKPLLLAASLLTLPVAALADYQVIAYADRPDTAFSVSVVHANDFAWRRHVVEVAAVNREKVELPVTVVTVPNQAPLTDIEEATKPQPETGEDRVFESIRRDQATLEGCNEYGNCSGEVDSDLDVNETDVGDSPDPQREYLPQDRF